MGDPRKTGISGITGKTVYIRHAGDSDRVSIREYCERHHLAVDITAPDTVAAVEDDRLIGFGILERSAAGDGRAALTILEDGRRRGIGAPILRHLMEYGPVKKVQADGASAPYLERLGFQRVRTVRGKGLIYERIERPSRRGGRGGTRTAA